MSTGQKEFSVARAQWVREGVASLEEASVGDGKAV